MSMIAGAITDGIEDELYPVYEWKCTNCGTAFFDSPELSYKYCPYCGKKIQPEESPTGEIVEKDELFTIVHPGTFDEWTKAEVEDYAKRCTDFVDCSSLFFTIDKYGNLYLNDHFGNKEEVNRESFELAWVCDDYNFAMVIHNGRAWRRV